MLWRRSTSVHIKSKKQTEEPTAKTYAKTPKHEKSIEGTNHHFKSVDRKFHFGTVFSLSIFKSAAAALPPFINFIKYVS